jgi:hypothetical protein
MADTSTTDPADQDPISQTTTAANALNFKHFVDTTFQYSNLMLGNAIANQQSMNSFNQALLARCTDMILDKSANAVVDGCLDQISAKVAQTTPPDTSGQLASLAAQVAALVSIVQGAYGNSPTLGTQAAKT